MTGTILPPALRHLLPRAEWRWPDDHDARRALTMRLCAGGTAAREALYAWAHASAAKDAGVDVPTRAQWAAWLGVNPSSIGWQRRASTATRALLVAPTGPRPSTVAPTRAAIRARERRAEEKAARKA